MRYGVEIAQPPPAASVESQDAARVFPIMTFTAQPQKVDLAIAAAATARNDMLAL